MYGTWYLDCKTSTFYTVEDQRPTFSSPQSSSMEAPHSSSVETPHSPPLITTVSAQPTNEDMIANISNLTVEQNSSVAIFNCSTTNSDNIIWRTPAGVISVTDGPTLIVKRPGPAAAGVYQCVVTNGISFDHREIILSVPSDNNDNASSRISSVNFTDSIISPAPSTKALVSFVTNYTPSISLLPSIIFQTSSTDTSPSYMMPAVGLMLIIPTLQVCTVATFLY